MLHNPLRIPPRHPVEHGLVLYFPLEKLCINKAIDFSMYGNHGTIYGASWVPGKRGWALSFNGVNAYCLVGNLSFYGWREITIAEWIYAHHPQSVASWSKFSMIGFYASGWPSTYHGTNNLVYYTELKVSWVTVKPDSSLQHYVYDWFGYRNQWVFLVRRFTSDREYSMWVNGEKKYAANVPSNYKTILEQDPSQQPYGYTYTRFTMGANTVGTEQFKCMYDDTYIFSRALSKSEIMRLYEAGRPWRIA